MIELNRFPRPLCTVLLSAVHALSFPILNPFPTYLLRAGRVVSSCPLPSLPLVHPHPVSFHVKVSSSLNSRNVDREDERQKPPRFNNRLSVTPFSPPFFSNFLFYDLATCRNFIGWVIISSYFYYSLSFAINLALYLLQQTSLRPVDIPTTL
jgi:hypothetical protein